MANLSTMHLIFINLIILQNDTQNKITIKSVEYIEIL